MQGNFIITVIVTTTLQQVESLFVPIQSELQVLLYSACFAL